MLNAQDESKHLDPIEQALENCASEPAHIPGTIQNSGVLLAFHISTRVIEYVSDNTKRYFGVAPPKILGADAEVFLGKDAWHALNNVSDIHDFSSRRYPVGRTNLFGTEFELFAFASNEHIVVELEPLATGSPSSTNSMEEINTLLGSIRQGSSEIELLDSVVDTLRSFTGFDRVLAFRFDQEFNGEIIAESKKSHCESFLGLRFPSWDIPSQARDIMKQVPVRFIANADDTQCSILANTRVDTPVDTPIDITYAHFRGVSPVHIEYLNNLGVKSTMSLAIVIDNELWGMLSFHHLRPRLPSTYIRAVCSVIKNNIEDRIALCIKNEKLQSSQRIESIRTEFDSRIELAMQSDNHISLKDLFSQLAPRLMDCFSADGAVLSYDSEFVAFGTVPDDAVFESINRQQRLSRTAVVAWDEISKFITDDTENPGEIAGVLIMTFNLKRAIYFFRKSRSVTVKWAGNPEKHLIDSSTTPRLSPRNSFAEYITTVHGTSTPWLPEEISLGRSIWTVFATNLDLGAQLQRQQSLLIDELNHRVRNIIALIRSVSRQARRHYTSLDSYSQALEHRIHALAAAHDIGAGQAAKAVSIKQVIDVECEPYVTNYTNRIRVIGKDRWLKSEQAPLFALVIHELITNATKYGALSNDQGRVEIDISTQDSGVLISWEEIGGPPVVEPENQGFGTGLITQAVPHEFSGRAQITYDPQGVQASFWLPETIFSTIPAESEIISTTAPHDIIPSVPEELTRGAFLVVEDNFMIADDIRTLLQELGVQNVEIVSNVQDANEIIENIDLAMVLLDINLGAAKKNSLTFAKSLKHQGISFLFVTGYGDRLVLPDELSDSTLLKKPVTTKDLCIALANHQTNST